MSDATELLQGMLDLLILKAVSLGRLHGYGVLLRISRFPATGFRSSRARYIRRCTASSTRD